MSIKLLPNVKTMVSKTRSPVWGFLSPSNIAEGMEKESFKEQMKFFDIAKGSAAEFATQTYIGIDIGYIDKVEGKIWIEESDHILSMLTNLKKILKDRNT